MYSDWGLVAWWTNISAFANLFWFHNYFKLGPDAGDSVFERYNDSQIFSYVVQACLTVWSAYKNKLHPISKTANFLSVVTGLTINLLIYRQKSGADATDSALL